MSPWGDCLRIRDRITCYQGDKVQFSTKGHFVSQGLILMCNWISFAGSSSSNVFGPLYGSTQVQVLANWYARVGTGAGSTIQSTVGLTTPVATAPSFITANTSNPSASSCRIAYVFVWASGTLTAITVTEFGLWLNNGFQAGTPTLATFGQTAAGNLSNPQFMARISSTDGDFTSFTVNTSVPLTLQWNLTFTYA